MIIRNAVVKNPRGIHVRPSGIIAQHFLHYPGKIEIYSGAEPPVSAKTALGIMSLGLQPGMKVKVVVEGPDEEEKCRELCFFLSGIYDYSHENVRLVSENV